jgi:hypothetical protein
MVQVRCQYIVNVILECCQGIGKAERYNLSWSIISKSMIYDFMIKASCKITVHYGFKYCGLITHYSSSQFGNSMSPTLYGSAQCSLR